MNKVDEQVLHCLSQTVKKDLHAYRKKKVYSAASLAIAACENDCYSDYYLSVGRSGENELWSVDEHTIFDLASLTKPLVTLLSILHLIDRNKISWNEPLASLLERPLDERFCQVDLQALLCHSSGFTAHRNYWKQLIAMKKKKKKGWLLDNILEEQLEYATGSGHLYSDVGYILLGYAVQIKSGFELHDYWRLNIAEPAGIENELKFDFQKDGSHFDSWVSTGHCSWSTRPLIGLVHDDNCRALEVPAGHAGLFGSSAGVTSLCKELMNLYHYRQSRLPLSAETFRKATQRVGNSDWSYGFSLPSANGSSSGTYFSDNSIGHLGFTGVSFWIDLEKQIAVTLLTNRVRQGDDMEGIRAARPALHDAVMTCLETKENPPVEPGDR